MNQKIKVSLFVYEKVQEVEGARGREVKRSRGRGVERIKVAGSKIPMQERQKNCYIKELYPRWQRKNLPSL